MEPQNLAVMEGGGAYNANSALQASGAALALPLFEQAAAETPAEASDRPVVIVDYGASQGRNSIIPLRRAIEVLRRRLGPHRAICVAHTDLPTNDFATLFSSVDGDTEAYGAGDPKIFPSAVGRSFYRAVLPGDYVDLAWSSYAAQWLSRVPSRIEGHIVCWRSAGAVRSAFVEQGKSDWERFLRLRAAELRRGGRLVICLPAALDNGLHPSAALFDVANSVLTEMLDEGAIGAGERAGMVVHVYPRTPTETLAPVASGALGLQVLASSFTPLSDHAWAQYEKDRDAEALAAKRAGFFRATFGPTLAQALKPSSDEMTRRAFLDRLEAGMRSRLAKSPTPFGNIVAILSLVKE